MRIKLEFLIFFILFSFYFFLCQSKSLTGEVDISLLDSYIEKKYSDWEIPGLSIAIVKNNEVIFSKGYGICEINKSHRVDANTIFAIASISKTFTSAAIANLIYENRLNWQIQVINYVPEFTLYDKKVTELFTISDLLSHRSGLKTYSGDLIWYGSDYSTDEIILRIKYLEPVCGFRSCYGYSNIMYMIAGEIISEVTSTTWNKFYSDTFLEPLEMNRTYTSANDIQFIENVATPHVRCSEKNIAIDLMNWDNIGAAGSMYSCANDMTKWIRFLLNEAIIKEDTIFEEKEIEEMWKIQTPIELSNLENEIFPLIHEKGYGFGWNILNYDGIKIVMHSGGYEGMTSQLCLIPDDDFGFVILTNSNHNFPYPLMFHIIDEYLGNKHIDYIDYFKSYNDKTKKAQNKYFQKLELERDTTMRPTIPIDNLLGLYSCELYEFAQVYIENDQLLLKFTRSPIFKGQLDHYKSNRFYIEMTGIKSLPKGFVDFEVEEEIINLQINIPNPDFDFSELKFKKPLNK